MIKEKEERRRSGDVMVDCVVCEKSSVRQLPQRLNDLYDNDAPLINKKNRNTKII